MFTTEYFDSELTTAKFDRTPGQRERTTMLLNLWRERGVDVENPRIANAMLTSDFVLGVALATNNRRSKIIGTEISTDPPSVDLQAVWLVAEQQIQSELAVLDAALPHPELDRLAAMED